LLRTQAITAPELANRRAVALRDDCRLLRGRPGAPRPAPVRISSRRAEPPWAHDHAQKSTRVGASIRSEYRPAANAEEDGAGTMLTLEMLDEALRNNLRVRQSAVV
jgi:hypothetical protein